ncbi:TetR/AcrR family transcriptional regulator [Nocardioides speluncae]|uniref:TetR/AcrR family transcriptional regulator n=1 Tax=Nocardioides speluncae TaxID=2670337 RepID=UPI000D68C7EB|nr:TetR/AcrR family transcriptional regulator [Nocardioides speluncae]
MTDDDELLDAALGQLLEFGVARTTTDDIARAAGVNRTTLYRRLGSKDDIVAAVILREVGAIAGAIRDHASSVDGYEERIVEGFVYAVTSVRENKLLRRALAVDRDAVLPAITVDGGPGLTMALQVMQEVHRETQQAYGIPHADTDDTKTAILARLIHSLVLMPDAPPVLRTPEELRAFAAVHVVPLAGPSPRPAQPATRRRRGLPGNGLRRGRR